MSSSFLSIEQIQDMLLEPEHISVNSFSIVKSLCTLFNNGIEEYKFQEILLRVLEFRQEFGPLNEIIDGLLREVGLFPYLNPEALGLADRIAYEFHKPLLNFGSNFVFHRPQAYVYRELLFGKNIILSAPTSFGKSLIIDAMIASEKFNNILVIVPTIALIDETRRRLSMFGKKYKIITHTSQAIDERNIFIFTQERAIQYDSMDYIDFFVIDEFYKLDPERDSNERSNLLNYIFYKLVKLKKQFYMLGPSVNGISEEVSHKLEVTFIHEPYKTVVTELHKIPKGGNDLEKLISLCQNIQGQTMIFCRSPQQVAEVVKNLIDNNIGSDSHLIDSAIEWISKEYHPQWHFTRALERGIGVHHGRIPRSISQFVVRSFNNGSIKFLVCTSTLIEGVNTKARNIIIYDNKISRKKYDYFTFNNISGRSGRMFQHFVGHVYIFHEPPNDDLPLIDIPSFTQSDLASDSLLIQLDDDDLLPSSRDKLREYHEQSIISYDTLKANNGIDPRIQIALAREISSNLDHYHDILSWNVKPSYSQLKDICQLIWVHFKGNNLGGSSVRSYQHLTSKIWNLEKKPIISDMIKAQLQKTSDVDEAVSSVLDFLKLWAGFHFPRLLRAIGRIQHDIFSKNHLPPGEYDSYSYNVENLFLDPTLLALDEYGVPIQIARKISSILEPNNNLDDTLYKLKSLDIYSLDLSSFEQDILLDAQQHIT